MTKSPSGAIVNSRPTPAPTVGTVQLGTILAIMCTVKVCDKRVTKGERKRNL
jgi:hypothetical protein